MQNIELENKYIFLELYIGCKTRSSHIMYIYIYTIYVHCWKIHFFLYEFGREMSLWQALRPV